MPLKSLVAVAVALALAGCGSIGAIPIGGGAGKPVETGALPPPTGTAPSGTTASAEPIPGADAGAAAAPPPPPGTISRTDLLGGWTISSGGDSCQLFMTLTSWTGGYRASTRGCSSASLKSISAWNLSGKQVVLAGQGGSALGTLNASGGNRFDGTISGAAVSFYR